MRRYRHGTQLVVSMPTHIIVPASVSVEQQKIKPLRGTPQCAILNLSRQAATLKTYDLTRYSDNSNPHRQSKPIVWV